MSIWLADEIVMCVKWGECGGRVCLGVHSGEFVVCLGAIWMGKPPSITRFSPFIIAAASLARNKAQAAISSGYANRPVGIFFFIASPTSPAQALRPSSVRTTVGEIALV